MNIYFWILYLSLKRVKEEYTVCAASLQTKCPQHVCNLTRLTFSAAEPNGRWLAPKGAGDLTQVSARLLS